MSIIRKKSRYASSHARPHNIIAVAGDIWDTAFKFTAERHPYEKALSLAHHVFRGNPNDELFPLALDAVVRSRRQYVSYPWYVVDGKVIVDDFVRHETIPADMKRICERLGLPGVELPRARQHDRDRKPARRDPDCGAAADRSGSVRPGVRTLQLGALIRLAAGDAGAALAPLLPFYEASSRAMTRWHSRATSR